MNFSQCLQIIVDNPQDAMYELQVILYNITVNEIDQLTFVLLLHKRMFNLLDFLIVEENTSQIVELLVLIYSRYNIQRFPSFNGEMMQVLDKTYETLVNLANMDKIETLDALTQGFFRLLKNSYLYQYFMQNNGYVRLQNLIYQTFNYNSQAISCVEYMQQLIPQTDVYGYSNILYYIQELFWTFKDEKILRLQFLILINQRIDDENNTNLQVISNDDFQAVIKQQRNLRFMYHNIIYIITVYGSSVTQIMIDNGYFEIFSKIQNNLKDTTFTFITKLILQDTMQQQYDQQNLILLCKNCIVDNSLIVFYANQISYVQHFTKEIEDNSAQLLLSVFINQNNEYLSTCIQIIEYISKYDSNFFINYLVVPILGSSKYPAAILQYTNDKFSQMCQQQKYKQLTQSKQLLIFQSLLNDFESGQQFFLEQLQHLAFNYKKIGYVDNLIEYFKQKIQDIVDQHRSTLQISFQFEVLYCYLNNIIIAYTDDQIKKYGIYQQLIQLSKKHETVRYLCYKAIFRLNFGQIGQVQFNKMLRFIQQQMNMRLIDHCIENDIFGMSFNNQDLIDQLLRNLYHQKQYIYLYVYLKFIYKIYDCENILLTGYSQSEAQKLLIKRCNVSSELSSSIYDLWRLSVRERCQIERCSDDVINVGEVQKSINIELHPSCVTCKAWDDNGPLCCIGDIICSSTWLIGRVHILIEQLAVSLLSFAPGGRLSSALLHPDATGCQAEKYLLVVVSSIQRRAYRLSFGQFLSQLPTSVFSIPKSSFFPFNINTSNLVADTRHISEFKLPLYFQNFNLHFSVFLKECSKIFTISEYFPSKNVNFIAVSYQNQQLMLQLFDHNTCIGVDDILQRFVEIEIQIQETKGHKIIDQGQVAINDTLLYDQTTKQYKQNGIQLQCYILNVCIDKQIIYQEIVALPQKTIIVIERSYLQLYPDVYYNSLQIKQNNTPLLNLDRGVMHFYHGICLSEGEYFMLFLQQTKFVKCQYEDISTALSSEAEAQKQTKISDDQSNAIYIQNGCISLSYQNQLHQSNVYNFKCYLKQGQNTNFYEIEQNMTLCQMEEIDAQTKSMILRKVSLNEIKYRADYTQLECISYLNSLIIQLERSKDLQFDLVYLNAIIWRSKYLFDYFQQQECFQQLLLSMNNLNQKDYCILIMFKIIGFNIQISTLNDKKYISKIMVSDYQSDQNMKNLVMLLKSSIFQNLFDLEQKLNVIEFICQDLDKYPNSQRIQIMRTTVELIYQYLDECVEQESTELILSKLKHIQQCFLKFYDVEQRNVLITFQPNEIFQYSQVINYQLLMLTKHLYDTQNNQSPKMTILYDILIPYILNIDKNLLIIYYNNDQIVKEQYLHNVQLILGSLSVDVLILILQHMSDKSIIQKIFTVINIIQSQQQMITNVNLNSQVDNLLYHDLQYCIQPFNIQNLLYTYVNTQIKEITSEMLEILLQMSLNRYNVLVTRDFQFQTSQRINEDQVYNIINYNVFFAFFKICQQNNQYEKLINIVCFLLQQQKQYNIMFTIILGEIMKLIILKIDNSDAIYQQLVAILSSQQDIGQTIDQFRYTLQQLDSIIYIKEKNVFSILFLNKLMQLLFSSKIFKDAINLLDLESEIYTALDFQINDRSEENSSTHSRTKISRSKSIIKQPQQNAQQTIIYLIISVLQQYINDQQQDYARYHIFILMAQHYYIQLIQQQSYKQQNIESLLQAQNIHKIMFSQFIHDDNLYFPVQLMLNIKAISYIFMLGLQMANENILYGVNQSQIEYIIQLRTVVYSEEFYIFISNMKVEEQKQQFSLLQLNQIYYQMVQAIMSLINCSIYKCIDFTSIEKIEQFNFQQFQYNNYAIEYTLKVFNAFYLNESKMQLNLNVFENITKTYYFLSIVYQYVLNGENKACKNIILQMAEQLIQNIYDKKVEELSTILQIKQLEKYYVLNKRSRDTVQFESVIRNFQFNDVEINHKLYILQYTSMFNQAALFREYLQHGDIENESLSKEINLDDKQFANQNSIKIIYDILSTLQQKQCKISESNYKQISVESRLSDYLHQNFMQLVMEQEFKPIFLNTTPIYHRIVQQQPSIFGDTRYVQQSQYINGHTYERLFISFATMTPYRRRKEKIMNIFNSFKEVQPNMYYSMRLQVQGNRVGYTFLYDKYIYVFSDSPQGEYFLQNKQSDSFKDFDVLVDSHISETRKAYKRLPASPSINAELFNDQYWQAQLSRYNVEQIITIIERDYGGLSSAVDLYFNNGYSLSLVFTCYQELQDFLQTIIQKDLPLLRFRSSYIETFKTAQLNIDKLLQIFQTQQISRKTRLDLNKQIQLDLQNNFDRYVLNLLCSYQAEQINTFQLIYECNILSGRSCNDLSQYFIFPVLYGTHGAELELQPRNLQLPVLFQGKQRLNDLIQKYQSAKQFNVQSSISAIHYSHCAIPCWWAIREEPFASAHLLLQGCKFDAGDRLFGSVCAQFGNSMFWNQQNCEENIPEIFYDAFILINVNGYDLGCLQSGESVNDVILYNLPGDAKYKQMYYSQLQLDYLNLNSLKQHIYEWLSIIFSSKGYMVKIFDEVSSIYPPIGNYVQISKKNADDSLKILMKQANETIPHSVVMKLIYFGKQPKPLFVSDETAINIDDKKREEIQSIDLLSDFLKGYYESTERSYQQIENNDDYEKIIQYKIKQRIQYAIGNVIEAIPLNIEKYVRQVEKQNVINPGLLCGRNNTVNYYSFYSNRFSSENSTKFANQIKGEWGQLNPTNSILLNGAFCVPDQLKLLFAPGKNMSLYAMVYSKKHLKIYGLPECFLHDRQYIGENVLDYVISTNNYLQFSGTHSVYLLRDVGIIDIYDYNIFSKKMTSIGYLTLWTTQNDTRHNYIRKPKYKFHYLDVWGLLLVYTQNGDIEAFDILNLQRVWIIDVESEIIQIHGNLQKPLIIVLTNVGIKMINIRNMFISPSVISERFECIVYSDYDDIIYAAKNSFLHKIENVYKNHLSSIKPNVKVIGHLENGSKYLESSVIRKMFLVNNYLYLYVKDEPEKYMYVVDLELL